MGVRGLQSFLKQNYSKSTSMEDLLLPKNAKLRIGIDISYYIYKWQGDPEKILQLLSLLQSNSHRFILAFDGRAEDGKQWEAERRRQVRQEELKTASNLQQRIEAGEYSGEEEKKVLERAVQDHQRKGWSLSREARQTLKERLYREKVPMVKAKGESDGLLAAMSASGDVDIVISGDMDLLVMGAKVLWTPVGDGYQFREYVREEILDQLKLTDYQFRSMCAMCFTEASEKLNAIDIQRAYHSMRVFRSLSAIRYKYPQWLDVWPEDDHILYRSTDKVDPWIREDQKPIYRAFVNVEPMPYTDE